MAEVKNKRLFKAEIESEDGSKREVEFAVVRPNNKVVQTATLVYNREFRTAIENRAYVRAKIEQVMRDQKLWDDAKQAEYEAVVKRLLTGEKKLAEGGIKLSEGRKIAIDMRQARRELRELNVIRNDLDSKTAEAVAEQGRFNFLVSACTVYNTDEVKRSGTAYFDSADDYESRDNDPVVLPAAQNFGRLYYGLEDDYEAKLPENKFLLKYGFCDEKLRLVRKTDKRLIDERDRLVDEKGRLVNERSELVDSDGNLLTEDGDYKVDEKPFIDDTEETAVAAA